jgi:hypothetical protein
LNPYEAYEVLGVEPWATDDEVRAAWRSAVRELHPDTRDPSLPAGEADAALRLVNEAWEALHDRAEPVDGELWRERTVTVHGGQVVRFPWWLVALAVLLVIFVFTAYAGAPAGPVGR